MAKRHKVRELGEAVDDHHDGIVAFRRRQPLYEIHRQVLPGGGVDRQGREEASRLAVLMLGLLADRALAHVLLDVPL